MEFEESSIRDIHKGFMLGVRISEHLNGVPPNSVFGNPSLAALLMQVAIGEETLLGSPQELNLPPEEMERAGEHRRLAEVDSREAARAIIAYLSDFGD